jgi:hypothetical protein
MKKKEIEQIELSRVTAKLNIILTLIGVALSQRSINENSFPLRLTLS